MKKILFVLCVFISIQASALKYHVSASGNDANAGTSPAASWRTITKVNASMASMASGDTIAFKKGDVFYGQILVGRSGLFFDSYGNGSLPVITGYTTIKGWTYKGAGVWSALVSAAKANLINVSLNGQLQRLGRYPNADAANGGYLTYETANSSTQITDNELTTTPYNWTGAQSVIRKNNWVIDSGRITAHSGGALTYVNTTGYTGLAGFGYFIQDDVRTLDQFGEWFLNKTTKEFSMYFGDKLPGNYLVKAATIDTTFIVSGNWGDYPLRDNTTISNIAFEGSNKCSIFAHDGTGVYIKYCNFNNVGKAIHVWNMGLSGIDYNAISNTISIGGTQKLNTGFSTCTNNSLSNIALFAGMGMSGTDADIALEVGGFTNVQYNKIKDCGYHGIYFSGTDIYVQNNLVENFCRVKDDGGGIYCYAQTSGGNRNVWGNIVLNGIGSFAGQPSALNNSTHSIYIDGASTNVFIKDNTCINTAGREFLYKRDVKLYSLEQ